MSSDTSSVRADTFSGITKEDIGTAFKRYMHPLVDPTYDADTQVQMAAEACACRNANMSTSGTMFDILHHLKLISPKTGLPTKRGREFIYDYLVGSYE